jgi:hypothetical protein
MTLGFILVPAGAVRPAVACSGHYIALHRGARRGGLQVWRETRPGLHVLEVLIEATANIVVKAGSVRVIAIRRRRLPCGWGIALPFIGQGERAIYRCAALFSYVWRCGEQCHGVDDCPVESCSSRGAVARFVLVQERLRGWWCRGWLSGRRPRAGSRGPSTGVRTRHSGRHGDAPSLCVPTSSGMSSQYPTWRGSGGDGHTGLTATEKTAPAGPTSLRSPV